MILNNHTMSAIIHLGILDLPDNCHSLPEHWPGLLNGTDAERYQSIVRPARRTQFLIGRLLLASVASQTTSISVSPSTIALEPNGRPYLPDYPDLAIGLSHSKRRIIAACGPVPVIGLDTEWRDERRPLLRLAEHSFGKAIAECWANLPTEQLLDKFYTRWCRHEACYKAGLSDNAPASHSENWHDSGYQHCLLSTVPFEVVCRRHSVDTLAEIYL